MNEQEKQEQQQQKQQQPQSSRQSDDAASAQNRGDMPSGSHAGDGPQRAEDEVTGEGTGARGGEYS
jgi:hypothetical protein